MVTVLVGGAVDNEEPIFEYRSDAEEYADSLVAELESDVPRGETWEILISEVAVGDDSIEGSGYQTDNGLYVDGVGKSDT